jgi:hypothetical protein
MAGVKAPSMKIFLLVITFIFSSVFLVSCCSVDACMDAGGQWSGFGFSCDGASGDFIPMYMRLAPLFWGLVIIVSSLVTLFVKKFVPDT